MANSPYGMFFQPLDVNGNPYPGALLYCLQAGGAWPANAQAVYSDYACTTPLSNPVVADANGVFAAHYLTSATGYKFILKTAAGVTLRTDDNVYGGISYVSGGQSATSANATPAYTGTNNSTGPGVKAVNAGTGLALDLVAPTVTPTRGTFRELPQSTAPSAPLVGESTVNGTTGLPQRYTGAVWHKALGQVYALTAAESQSAGTLAYFTAAYTVPANSLVVGSRIKIRAAAAITATAGGGNVTIGLYFGGWLACSVTNTTAAPDGLFPGTVYALEADFIVNSVGAGGTVSYHGTASATDLNGMAHTSTCVGSMTAKALDTTASNAVQVGYTKAAGTSATAQLRQLTVEIC